MKSAMNMERSVLAALLVLVSVASAAELPDAGEAHRFNKIGISLDVSHVQMARYIETDRFASSTGTMTSLDMTR